MAAAGFRSLIRAEGARLYRDLPWRNTRDPYVIWLSEVMLQQTQVMRVERRMPTWLERFPSVEALAAAEPAEVLSAWQGMGYNRRALALLEAARVVVDELGGRFPSEFSELVRLPGIGPATAQGIRSFAFDLPGVYLETNVRTVFLHHFFPDAVAVPDRELIPLISSTCPAAQVPDASIGAFAAPLDENDTPRSWYYALLDYGAHLKRTIPNPSRRSSSYVRQSPFEGSRRQKRSHLVRLLLAARETGSGGLEIEELRARVSEIELRAGRPNVDETLVVSLLAELSHEGFCQECRGRWHIS